MKRTLWKVTYYPDPDDTHGIDSKGHRTWGAAIDYAQDTHFAYDDPTEYPAPPPVTPRATLRRFRDAGLNLSQSEALCLVAESLEGIQLKAVAASLGVSSATVTTIADALTKKGFARRRRGMDRRAEWLDITEEGYSLTTKLL